MRSSSARARGPASPPSPAARIYISPLRSVAPPTAPRERVTLDSWVGALRELDLGDEDHDRLDRAHSVGVAGVDLAGGDDPAIGGLQVDEEVAEVLDDVWSRVVMSSVLPCSASTAIGPAPVATGTLLAKMDSTALHSSWSKATR